MSLESVKAEPGLASRVIAFNGRFATLPTSATTQTTIHLIHGGEDRVIELSHAVAAGSPDPGRRGCDAGYR